MGYRDTKKSFNAYHLAYMKKRWVRRRKEAVERLGGHCVVCGETRGLQFDHKDPKTKKFSIAGATSFSEKRFWKEVLKCQLLCKQDHKEKSNREHIDRMTKVKKRICACGRIFNKLAEYVGHRAWCKEEGA